MSQINIAQAIIAQIKSLCPIFQGNVMGAADFAVEFENTQPSNLPLPAAYVTWLETKAGPNESATGYMQLVTDTYRVSVCLDNSVGNSVSKSGIKAIQPLNDIKYQLLGAVAHWKADPQHQPRGFELVGGSATHMNNARLWIYFDFSMPYWLGDADVWVPTGIPLTSVQTNITFK